MLVTSIMVIPQFAYAERPVAFKYGDSWRTLSYDGKLIFIEDYSECIMQGIYDANDVITGKQSIAAVKMHAALNIHNTYYDTDILVLIQEMYDIYKDPANIYIKYDLVMLAAKDKLDGKTIEERLTSYRKLMSKVPR